MVGTDSMCISTSTRIANAVARCWEELPTSIWGSGIRLELLTPAHY